MEESPEVRLNLSCLTIMVTLVFLHHAQIFRLFTKDFRGGEQMNESID